MDSVTEHPRVCGENVADVAGAVVAEGTSPRMRGKHFQRQILRTVLRNIPAYAGKTNFERRC